MDPGSTNPLAALTFISAPAILTNASCVLLFGAGNRYARAVDRLHELSRIVDGLGQLEGEEAQLRVTQLQAAEDRALSIVRALTCFYGSVAAFVASTLIGLLGGVVFALGPGTVAHYLFILGLALGAVGVGAMITGALLLVFETKASFTVLRMEKDAITRRLRRRMAAKPESA